MMTITTNLNSLKVWSLGQIGTFGFAIVFLVALWSMSPVFSWPAAIAAGAGAFVLRHFGLHGRSILRGTAAQRLFLVAAWLGIICLAAFLARLYAI